MAVSKLNLLTSMLNFSSKAVNPVETGNTGAIGGSNPAQTAPAGKSNLFAGNTEGVNTKIGIGDASYIAAQAGKKAGKGTTYAFA